MWFNNLKPSGFQRDNADLNKLIDGIGIFYREEFRDESLYCISMGKVIPADTAESIFSTTATGSKMV